MQVLPTEPLDSVVELEELAKQKETKTIFKLALITVVILVSFNIGTFSLLVVASNVPETDGEHSTVFSAIRTALPSVEPHARNFLIMHGIPIVPETLAMVFMISKKRHYARNAALGIFFSFLSRAVVFYLHFQSLTILTEQKGLSQVNFSLCHYNMLLMYFSVPIFVTLYILWAMVEEEQPRPSQV